MSSKNVLIVGYGGGLSSHLLNSLEEFDNLVTVSRSEVTSAKSGHTHVKADADDFDRVVTLLRGRQFSLVVIVAFPWGESGKMLNEEFQKFLLGGSQLPLKVFNGLNSGELLGEGATFVNIGSIASETASLANVSANNPLYGIGKACQKSVIVQLSRIHRAYTFCNITLGSIGDGVKGVGYANICKTIDYLEGLGSSVNYVDVDLVSNIDVK